jgi:hypothetical protein
MKIVLWLIGGFIAFVVIGNLMYDPNDPKTRDRDAIALCWKEQGRKSLDASTAQFAASTCEMMEARFKKTWNANP